MSKKKTFIGIHVTEDILQILEDESLHALKSKSGYMHDLVMYALEQKGLSNETTRREIQAEDQG
jgi:hypothetical protein